MLVEANRVHFPMEPLSTKVDHKFMSYLVIDPKKETPCVEYDRDFNKLTIKGNSHGDAVVNIYEDVIELMQDHYEKADRLDLYLHIYNLNTYTIKYLFQINKTVKTYTLKGKQTQITWAVDYDDTDMIDIAFDFSELFDIKYDIVAA